jgi:hypothetical protein
VAERNIARWWCSVRNDFKAWGGESKVVVSDAASSGTRGGFL